MLVFEIFEKILINLKKEKKGKLKKKIKNYF